MWAWGGGGCRKWRQSFKIWLKDLVYLDLCPHTHAREEDAAPQSHTGGSGLVRPFPFRPNLTLTHANIHTHTHITQENGKSWMRVRFIRPAVIIVQKVSQDGQKIEQFSQIGKRKDGNKRGGMAFQVIHPKLGRKKKEKRKLFRAETKEGRWGTKIEDMQQAGLSPAVESRSSYFWPVCQRLQKQRRLRLINMPHVLDNRCAVNEGKSYIKT